MRSRNRVYLIMIQKKRKIKIQIRTNITLLQVLHPKRFKLIFQITNLCSQILMKKRKMERMINSTLMIIKRSNDKSLI